MLKNIENLKIEGVYQGVTQRGRNNICRKKSAFVFRISGSIRYIFENGHIDANPGDAVFLPAGLKYSYEALTSSPCDFVSIRFSASMLPSGPFSISLENFQEFSEIKNSLANWWNFGDACEHYKCYSLFYKLLSHMEALQKTSYLGSKKEKLIAPAIAHIKEHLYDPLLKTDSLHELCGVSGAYFRKLFRMSYSLSPQEYILEKRLSYAKTLIDNSTYKSLSEVAAESGYNDPLYFSRAFKRKYGISPSQYRNTL